MKKVENFTKVFLVIVGLAFLNVAIQAFINPQDVMDFVSVDLGNISARNSTRAYYGGVNLTFSIFFFYGAFKKRKEALTIVALYGGGFGIGRIYSILTEGVPSEFILTWLTIEIILTLIALGLLKKLKQISAV